MTDIKIYTDGAIVGGNPGGSGGWCAILLTDKFKRILRGRERPTTNNRMELRGPIEGLQIIRGNFHNITLYSDSQYVVNGINDWMHKWKKRGWRKLENNDEVKNKELWQTIYNIYTSLKKRKCTLKAEWVRGHSEDVNNDEADTIAHAEAVAGLSPVFDINMLSDEMVAWIQEEHTDDDKADQGV